MCPLNPSMYVLFFSSPCCLVMVAFIHINTLKRKHRIFSESKYGCFSSRSRSYCKGDFLVEWALGEHFCYLSFLWLCTWGPCRNNTAPRSRGSSSLNEAAASALYVNIRTCTERCRAHVSMSLKWEIVSLTLQPFCAAHWRCSEKLIWVLILLSSHHHHQFGHPAL